MDRTLKSLAPSLEDHIAAMLDPFYGLRAQFPGSLGILI